MYGVQSTWKRSNVGVRGWLIVNADRVEMLRCPLRPLSPLAGVHPPLSSGGEEWQTWLGTRREY